MYNHIDWENKSHAKNIKNAQRHNRMQSIPIKGNPVFSK